MKAVLWCIALLGYVSLVVAIYARATATREATAEAFHCGFSEGTVYALTVDADSLWAPSAAADSAFEAYQREGIFP